MVKDLKGCCNCPQHPPTTTPPPSLPGREALLTGRRGSGVEPPVCVYVCKCVCVCYLKWATCFSPCRRTAGCRTAQSGLTEATRGRGEGQEQASSQITSSVLLSVINTIQRSEVGYLQPPETPRKRFSFNFSSFQQINVVLSGCFYFFLWFPGVQHLNPDGTCTTFYAVKHTCSWILNLDHLSICSVQCKSHNRVRGRKQVGVTPH